MKHVSGLCRRFSDCSCFFWAILQKCGNDAEVNRYWKKIHLILDQFSADWCLKLGKYPDSSSCVCALLSISKPAENAEITACDWGDHRQQRESAACSLCGSVRRSRLEKDVAPNMSVALYHQWDLAARLACHPGVAKYSVIHHLQTVQQHCLSLQSAFDG